MQYPDDFLNKVVQGDCLEVMKDLPDKCVDMVLCDPPYASTQNSWDTLIDLEQMWFQYERVTKPSAAFVLMCSQPFTSKLGCSRYSLLRYGWIWKKANATGHLNAKRMPMKDYEDVLVFYRQQPTYRPQGLVEFKKVTRRGGNGTSFGVSGTSNFQEFTNYPRTHLEFAYDSNKVHPTQKPVPLFEYLIKTYTNEGEVVLDNCIGSGTTAVAAINTQRQFIGIELSSEYVAIAQSRIEQARNILTPTLVQEAPPNQ